MTLIRNKVLDRLRRDILSCDFAPGEELRESDLASRYNVSKSPVRDALQRLSFEGLIETVPRRGHRVVGVSPDDACNILDMRELLEAGACRRASAEASDAALTELDAYRSADIGSVEAFAVYNRDFHIALATVSGNRRLTEETVRLLDAYERMSLVSLNRLRDDAGDMSGALGEHCRLIDALQARDADRAARISRDHLARSRTQVIGGLERRTAAE